MGKERRAVRVFFSTFYEGDAEAIIGELRRRFGEERVRVVRSRNVPELYFVEISCDDPYSAVGVVEEVLRTVPDTIYGVKVYAVPPREGGSAG